MTFDELIKIMEEKFGSMKLADIAREFDVTPQVVSNWKSRNQVPYRYVKILREKIQDIDSKSIGQVGINPNYINFGFGKDADRNDEDDLELFQYMSLLYGAIVKNKLIVILFPLIISFMTAIHVLYFVEPGFTSSARILPASNNKNQVSGFAAQFGVSIGSSTTDISAAELYPDIIKSRILAKALLKRKFQIFTSDTASKTLLSILTSKNTDSVNYDSGPLIFKGINKLKNIISIKSSKRSPLIDITANANDPKLARDIVLAIIDELDSIQNKFKLNRIKEKRIFIENRIKGLDVDLSKSEEELKKFREQNRNISSSPALLLQQERLIRDLSVLTQLYITLKNEYEQIQIEEVENSRMFVVLDEPEIPLKRSSPNRKRRVILAFFSSILIIISIVTIKEWTLNNWDDKIKPLIPSL